MTIRNIIYRCNKLKTAIYDGVIRRHHGCVVKSPGIVMAMGFAFGLAFAAGGCSAGSSKAEGALHDTVYVMVKERYVGVNPYDRHMDTMPDDGCVKMKINPLGGTLGRVFNDSNYVHLEEAERIGIHPIETLADVWRVRRPVCHIKSCREYVVDSLTHSLPYLVPEAADLLKEIGARFNDSLQARGGGSYRLKVTSVLRTKNGIKKLRRRNGNAVEASAHQFGTTFDISYAKFICDSVTVNRTQEDLKNLLGEVLKAIRDEGGCYVKYERKQACFHITARDRGRNDDKKS